jgi:propanol-preferring alcohol dehydrogenase
MTAMQLRQAAPIESAPLVHSEVPDPAPGPGEVRVRVRCCAVCRTDLHVVEGDLPPATRPIIPGHQIVGVVDQLGEGCRRLKVGMRVGVAWLRHACGVCRFCRSGRENLCERSRYTGYHADGGFAQYAVVPEAFAYELPDAYGGDVSVAPLLCAGIIGYRAMKRCLLATGGRLGIFGFGSSAHIVLQLALRRGHEVYVVSRGEAHRRLAGEMGAAWCGAEASEMPERVDAAIVFAPSGAVVPAALAALDSGGVVALAGIHMTPIPALDYPQHLYRERDVHPVTANTREDGWELLAEAAAAGVRPRTTIYPLREANRALADLKAGRVEGTAVLLLDGGGGG